MSYIWMNHMAGRMNHMRLMRSRWLRHHWFIYRKIPLNLTRLWEEVDLALPLYRKAKKVRRKA
jgi:hypothetical protein